MAEFDVVVVGAGQAGIEAALAGARLGSRTLCVTLRIDRIGHLPCNCSIGGPAKGHIAREVDALGGQMGVTTDHTLTHLRRVGTSKGPAVQTIRAQVCKQAYPEMMRQVLLSQAGLTLWEGEVLCVIEEGGAVAGVLVRREGEVIQVACRSVVLTTGTFLNGLCHEGRNKTVAARHGDQAVGKLGSFLRDLGINIRRFKTGTTPRIRWSSVDAARTHVMPSEPEAGPLSFLHDHPFPRRELLPTWQTHTNEATHALLRERLHESAMYAGEIEGVGPRYCPSIEDKVVRFAEKSSHPVFLEIEEWDSESTYVQGFSSSLPGDIQLAALRTIPGLGQVEMIRPGYAVEYDMADPTQLFPSLMSKLMPGLFLAGQINGTSGYEEAAGQGIVAGINASRHALGEAPVPFPRSQSFIGVMIDDLVTKGVDDPYRMLTARAEHRLFLRHDNADQRLTPLGRDIGLVDTPRWHRFEAKMDAIERGNQALAEASVTANQSELLTEFELEPVRGRATFSELLRRPRVTLELLELVAQRLDLSLEELPAHDPDRPGSTSSTAREQIAIAAIYHGYLSRQEEEIAHARSLEELAIPANTNFEVLTGLSYESREKLGRMRPTTLGQASRIPGIRPTDVALLAGYLRGKIKY